MQNRVLVCIAIGFEGKKRLSVYLRVFVMAENDCQGMPTWETLWLPIVAAACLIAEVDKIILLANRWLDFVIDIIGWQKPISPCSIIDRCLDLSCDLGNERPGGVEFVRMPLCIPIHQLMPNTFKHRKDRHFSFFQ